MSNDSETLTAARADARWIVRDRMHDVRLAAGDVQPHTPRHAKEKP